MKNRSLAGFDEVASVDKTPLENATDQNKGKNNTPESKKSSDMIDNLIETSKKQTIMKGFVLDADVAKAIDRISKGKGRGFKSEFVNAVLKQVLSEKGLI